MSNGELGDSGITVSGIAVNVGEKHFLFGIITKLEEHEDGSATCLLNNQVDLHLEPNPQRLDVIKDRIFETGIFYSEITSISEEKIEANCMSVIYGRKQKMGLA